MLDHEVGMTRRRFLRSAAAVGGGLFLAACGGKKTSQPATAPEKVTVETREVKQEPAAKAPIELKLLSPNTAEVEMAWSHHWVDLWNEQNPDVKVSMEDVGWEALMTKARAYIAANEPVDMAWQGANREKYKMGWCAPIEGCLEDTRDIWREDWVFAEESPLIIKEGDKTVWFGVPHVMDGATLIVRRDLLKAAGIDDPIAATETWDDVRETIAKITHKPDVYGWNQRMPAGGVDALVASLFRTNGLRNLADFSSEEAYLEVIEFMQSMWEYTSPDSVTWEWRDGIRAFAKGVTATLVTGAYFYGDLVPTDPELLVPEKFANIPLPKGPRGTERMVEVSICGHWIFKQSKHPEESCAFMKWMCEDEQLLSFPMSLTTKKGVTGEHHVNNVLAKIYPDWFGPQSVWYYKEWYDITSQYKTYFAQNYMPSEEINKIWSDQCIALYNKQINPEKMYENVKAGIEPILIT